MAIIITWVFGLYILKNICNTIEEGILSKDKGENLIF